MSVARCWRHESAVAVGLCPAVSVVADERGRLTGAGHPEVGFAWTKKGGHTRESTGGNPEN